MPISNEILKTLQTASRSSGYYNDLWDESSSLTSQEVARAEAISEVLSDFADVGDLQILDLGCGRGWLAPYLAKFGQVTGVDFAQDGIDIARKRYNKYGTFSVADPCSTRLGISVESQFDVVVCSEVIEHVQDPMVLLTQISSFLKEGGLCVLTTPNGLRWKSFESSAHTQLQPIENWLKPGDIAGLLGQCRFHVIRHEGIPIHKIRSIGGGWLSHRYIQLLSELIGFRRAYRRTVLKKVLYQLVAARYEPN